MFEWTSETAESYAATYGEHATIRLGIAAVDLGPTETIVDIGCGTGSALRQAASRVTQGRLVGVDPTPRMIEIAEERARSHPDGHRIEFILGSAEKLPIQDGEASVVLAFDSLDHWTDRAAGLAEVARILASDGRFVILKDHEGPGGVEAMTAFRDQLRTAGFSVQNEQELSEDEVVCTLWTCRRA